MRRRDRRGPLRGAAFAVLLLGLATAARSPADGAEDELRNIDKELQVEMKELRSVLSDLDETASEAVLLEFRTMVLPEFAERYAAVARANPGETAGLQAWVNLIELSGRGYEGELFAEALKALATDFVEREEMAAVAQSLQYTAPASAEEHVLATLETLAEKSPHREVQAYSLLSLAGLLGDDREASDPRVAKAKVVLDRLAGYGDVEYRGGGNFEDKAASVRFALDNLLVGMKCPDFEATDAEGVDFKLSDYRGRVVLIDFWGFW